MKLKRLGGIMLCMVVCLQLASAQRAELMKLMREKRYTELEQRIAQSKDDVRFHQAVLLNVFNRPTESNTLIAQILKNNEALTDSQRYYLLEAQHDNYVKLFEYDKAFQTKQNLLNNYRSFYKSEDIEDETSAMDIWKALRNEPKQTVTHAETVVLKKEKNFANLFVIPVFCQENKYDFIF